MGSNIITTLVEGKRPTNIGGKAEQLHGLINKCVNLPPTHVLSWNLYDDYLNDSSSALTAVRETLSKTVNLSKTYAVRSSANVEDSKHYSFAGQFSSLLHVQGIDNLVAAVQEVWDSTHSPTVQAYLATQNHDTPPIKMAVIIQEMVEPVVSGVSFSKNPMTGLDEIIVEAVRGSGEQLLQGGVTPDRWVYKWGAWIQKPPQTEIDETIITDVVAGTQSIAAKYRQPLDLEWVYSGSEIFWVQLREITTLNNVNIYSNRISREVLPGMIKPLVWSINVPLVNSAWIEIFTELIGPNDIAPHDLTKAFHYRAYFNMGVIGRVFTALGFPGETLEIMIGLEGGKESPRFRPSGKVIKHIPRMLKFLWAKYRFSHEIDQFLPEMDRTYAAFAKQNLDEMTPAELLAALEALLQFTTQSAYMNIIGPLLMQLYNGLFKRNLSRYDIQYEQFDLVHNMPAFDQFDPNAHLISLHAQYTQLSPQQQAIVGHGNYAEFCDAPIVPETFKTAVSQFIQQFGHLSESGNDFSRVPWRENPDFVLQMIIDWGSADHEKSTSNEDMLHWETAPLSPLNRWRLRGLFRRARQFRLYREAISFKYTYGYGLIRNYIMALASHLAQSGLLTTPEEIFYLYLDELRACVQGDDSMDVGQLVATRRDEMSAVENIILPEIIYGDQTPPPETNAADHDKLSGIPTSGGYFKGPVCIIKTLSEFDKMHRDAVLVIPYSDVSWTPLFARAGAVIAESGGMLSHSSIVAREQRVPAVVSVNSACDILRDGVLVTVDGYKGEVIVEE